MKKVYTSRNIIFRKLFLILIFALILNFNNYCNFVESKPEVYKIHTLKNNVQNKNKIGLFDLFENEKFFHEIISKQLFKTKGGFSKSNLKIESDGVRFLNITDFSLNAVLGIAQRYFHINYIFTNNTENNSSSLPINIDSQSLSLLIDELNQLPKNMNMSLNIYEDVVAHVAPKVVTDLEGVSLSVQIGIDFGVFIKDINKDDNYTSEATIVLSMDLPIKIKLQIEDINNKLSLGLNSVTVGDINIKQDLLGVNKEHLKTNFKNFLKVAIQGQKDLYTNIDILGKINEYSGMNLTKFDIVTEYGYTLINMRN